MLIYNHKKEFIGIDESDLNILGFANLEELKTEAIDFADMFVKTPGHVHNFKHVNWIDFVTCADSTESTKVIIKAKDKQFRCLLDIKTLYLNDDPASKAFLIYLTNIREFMDNDNLSDISLTKPISTPPPPPRPEPAFVPPVLEESPALETKEIQHEEIFKEAPETAAKETPPTFDLPIDLDLPLELDFEDDTTHEDSLEDDLKIDLEIHDDFQEDDTPIVEETQTSLEIFDNGYVFDPQVAADELGLPVDLIEEFIEDFIAQAKEFKEELYSALEANENDDVKILSHKLKGVAANLRIEDALESLIIINTSDNSTEVKNQLDILYKIIAKLAGEKVQVTKSIQKEVEKVEEEIPLLDIDEIDSLPDDEELDIFSSQEEAPSQASLHEPEIRIDIPELADDNFLKVDYEESTQNKETTERVESLNLDEDELDIFTHEEAETEAPQTIEEDIEPELEIEIELPEIIGENLEPEAEIEDTIEEATESMPQKITSSYDPELVASEIGLSQESFMELFEDYIGEAKELSHTLTQAIEDNNPKLWKQTAIELKGMSESMRINDFTSDLDTLIQTEDVEVSKTANSRLSQAITAISELEG